ncbi:bifunctional folylpolyglutamate synthase/dihydrofolate synthase [Alkalicoccus daliensis]|uniref:tetrahydrofolate synthase n=1 Tax=Alkalicoccus daliensis TaxID=745820 RepID=A0A1H0CLF3_9BACI|nr:Mur ligase family protein [Alkalicoccus daliensis]SDN58717.1 dihydrofolate synthase / folylpolyglutamate synthase [Alkalicoccus daliensis]
MTEADKVFTAREDAGIAYTLDRITKVMKELGEPQNTLPVIHVAGTNGKGSTVVYMETMLRKAGKTTAAFMTPSLGERHEQVLVNGEPVTEAVFAEAVARIMPAVEKVENERKEMVSPFELLTAAAFVIAAEIAEADVFLVEAGMGGKRDATNIVHAPRAVVLTSIGTDHAEFLGGTREAAAREKAGIMRKGVPCISACDKEAESWLSEEAEKIGALWEPISQDCDWKAPNILLTSGKTIHLPAPGAHQARNAIAAIAAASYITKVYEEDLEQASLPGRWEPFAENVYLDTAHNKEAVEAMMQSLPKGKKITFLTAVMRDKPVADMIRQWEKQGTVFVSEMPDPRGMTKEEWKKKFPHLHVVTSPADWIENWINSSTAGELLVITGSHDFIRFIKSIR